MNKRVLKYTISLKSDLHITGETQGILKNILYLKYNNGTKKMVIPATTIKGVMRAELERMNYLSKDAINYLFGPSEQESHGHGYMEPRLKFTDAICMSDNMYRVLERVHVTIDRNTLRSSEHRLFKVILVPKNTKFIGYILVKPTDLTDSELKLLQAAAFSLSHYGIGSGRSRGLGWIEFEIELSNIGEYLRCMGG